LEKHELRYYGTLVTDEQNTLSLCPEEHPTNLVTVRIPEYRTSHVSS
jgi:hypothetical protein